MEHDRTERFYDLAGVRLRIVGEPDELFLDEGILNGFRTNGPQWDHELDCRIVDALTPPAGEPVFRDPACRVFRSGQEHITYLGPVEHDIRHADIRVSRSGTRSSLEFRRAMVSDRIPVRLVVKAMEAEHLLVGHGALLFHASFIRNGEKAILFTAPSGTGKSTQADLWCRHMDAELINGDRVALRVCDGTVMACGIPFSGSSPVRKRESYPVEAIVYLSQAPDNSISRLRGAQAFSRIWEGCSIHTWDREDVTKAMETAMDVISRVSVYSLVCTPDVRAVELLHQTLEKEWKR